MTYKRYQRWTREGKVWSNWFPWDCSDRPKYQLKPSLLNEYREEDE